MNNLDRALQLSILEDLRQTYPSERDRSELRGEDHEDLQGNLFYLEEHGLIEAMAKMGRNTTGNPTIITAFITAKGLDFIEDDGGLTAILGKVTVRIDADQFRDLIAGAVQRSDLPAEKKSTFLQRIKELPAKGLEAAVLKAVELAVEHPDAVARAVGSVISQ
jgi:hypothetical protein